MEHLKRKRSVRIGARARLVLVALAAALSFGAGSARAQAPIAGAAESQSAPAAAAPAAPAAAAPASAAAPSWAYDLAGELMSPFCPGRTLASCPSPQAGELIQWIALQEAAGASRDEVIAMLVERHGEEILGSPPAKGITLWAYVFPVLGFVGFGLVAVLVLRRLVAAGGASSASSGGARPGVASASASPSVGSSSTPGAGAGVSAGASASRDDLARRVDAELAERA